MKPELLIALSETLKKEAKKNRPKVHAGVYQISGRIELGIKGEIEVLPDEQYVPTTSIPLIATIALFAEKAGITRESTKRLFIEALKEAQQTKVQAEGPIAERCRDIEAGIKFVKGITGSMELENRIGKVISKCVLLD